MFDCRELSDVIVKKIETLSFDTDKLDRSGSQTHKKKSGNLKAG